jgi:hypothetical protein
MNHKSKRKGKGSLQDDEEVLNGDSDGWRLRIVDSAEVPPETLMPNPLNWRSHPPEQQAALEGTLKQVGWVQQVLVNRRTGHLLDGHLRVSMAVRRKEATVPVLYVDLSEAEEAVVLATLDPLSAMAEIEREQLRELLGRIEVEEEAVQAMVSRLAVDAGILPPEIDFKEHDESVEDEVKYVECPSCGHRFPR